MAMVQGAVDAVNAIDGGHEGYLLTSRVATPTDSKDAAAATAAYKVLVSIVPVQEPVLTALYNASSRALRTVRPRHAASRWATPQRQR